MKDLSEMKMNINTSLIRGVFSFCTFFPKIPIDKLNLWVSIHSAIKLNNWVRKKTWIKPSLTFISLVDVLILQTNHLNILTFRCGEPQSFQPKKMSVRAFCRKNSISEHIKTFPRGNVFK